MLPDMQTSVLNQNKILNLMKESRIYWQARKQVINSMLQNRTPVWQPSVEEVRKLLQETKNQQKINGLINNCLQKSTKRLPVEKDANSDINSCRIRWSDLIVREFNNISGKMLRQEEYDEEDESVSYIYDSSALLQFLSSIKSKVGIKLRDSPIYLFPQETVRVPRYQQLKSKYNFLLIQQNVIGGQLDTDLRDRQKKGRKIADGEHISSEIQQYLCYGCSPGERVSVYRKYFQCFYEFPGKRVQFNLYERIWKPLIRADMIEIMNSEKYFVFREEMIKVFKIFICDKQLGHMVKIKQLSTEESQHLDKFAPIHATLPCKSFSVYIAPFCYTSTDPQDIYQLFQQVYTNYFVMLHTVSSLPDSILSLCVLFQELLNSTQKKIVKKLQSLCIQPLRLVFPWIFYCFINYIEPEQFFLLLDRIIGTKSLQILPLYCVSMFFKEKTLILEAKTQNEIQEILEDSLKEDILLETIRQFLQYHL